MTACLEPGCAAPAEHAALVALCPHHRALAAEGHPVEDVLPHPCLACGSRLGVRYPSGWLCAVCEWALGSVPDADLAPPRLDVVYYLRFEGRIKIGTTGNLRQRLGAIWHQELLAIERGDRALERRRHAEFAALRFARTEWFEHGPELQGHIDVLAGGADAWTLHARWRSELLASR